MDEGELSAATDKFISQLIAQGLTVEQASEKAREVIERARKAAALHRRGGLRVIKGDK